MKHLKFLSLFLMICLNSLIGFSQTNDSLIKDNQIDIIKPYKPILSDAIKIPANPNPEKPEFVKPNFTYQIPALMYAVSPTLYTIKPLSLGTMLLPKLKGNYLKMGFGNYQMPLGEVYVNSVRNKQLQAGFFFKHLSGQGDKTYNQFSNNTAYGYAKKMFAKGIAGIDGYYHRNKVFYFGNLPDNQTITPEPKAVFNLLDLKTNYQNTLKDSSKLNYRINLNYYHFNGENFKENDVVLNTIFAKTKAEFPFELEAGVQINNNNLRQVSGDFLNYQRIYVNLNPQVFLIGENYKLQGGFNATIASDSSGSKFHFFPKAEGNLFLIPNKLKAFVGFTGNLIPITQRNILTINPFIADIPLTNMVNHFDLYGGLTGEIGPQTNFIVKGSSLSVSNFACYTLDSITGKQKLVLDKESSKINSLTAEIQHQMNEKFRMGIFGKFNSFNLRNLTNAYSIPKIEVKLNTTYNIADKFLVKLDLFYWGERMGREDVKQGDGTVLGKEFKMNPLVDLNFGIDYRYSKSLSAFVNFNNIANNRYQRFFQYPVYGINIMGGFTFSF